MRRKGQEEYLQVRGILIAISLRPELHASTTLMAFNLSLPSHCHLAVISRLSRCHLVAISLPSHCHLAAISLPSRCYLAAT